ncbi:MAG TPA: hypothetical protein VE954_14765 [Oligoflexus sp.]|uniref:hypothetical protein n=1 Tax=Oligoflexus sp. TaxID=1971216 RepID=UPI002D5170D9|nr:hypothetical protein [Oligoflexus sp.]HYX34363.1 hypothetical protein [Oligoflexus sp.]
MPNSHRRHLTLVSSLNHLEQPFKFTSQTLSIDVYDSDAAALPIDLAEVRQVFRTVFETDRLCGWRSVLGQKIPLRIGLTGDSFVWADSTYGVTRELLRILNSYDYPAIIVTRSDLVAQEEYLSLLCAGRYSVQMPISGNHRRMNRLMEPGAPGYWRRVAALKKLAGAGIASSVRIDPLFPVYPDGYYSSGDTSARQIPKLPIYDENFIPELAEAKVQDVFARFARLPSSVILAISQATGMDFSNFYQAETKYQVGEMEHYYQIFKASCAANGIRFDR